MTNSKRSILVSLSLKCPFDLGCTGCPIEKIRNLRLEDRFPYIGNLENIEVDDLVSEHFLMYNRNFEYEAIRNHIAFEHSYKVT